MKPPLQALLIAPGDGMIADIITGSQNGSLREGHRDYKVGQPIILCCHLANFAVMADVTEVKHTFIKDLTDDDVRPAGFHFYEEVFHRLRKFYPNLNLDSPITVIRWANVRGAIAGG